MPAAALRYANVCRMLDAVNGRPRGPTSPSVASSAAISRSDLSGRRPVPCSALALMTSAGFLSAHVLRHLALPRWLRTCGRARLSARDEPRLLVLVKRTCAPANC
jgi:hypothetical protein